MTKRPRSASFISCDPASIHATMSVGDSLTLGAPSNLGGFRAPIFKANPGIKFVGRQFSVGYNEGYSGYRIDQIAAVVLPIKDDFSPDAILFIAGGNDILQGQSAAATLTELFQFADDLMAKASIDNVLIGTIPFLITNPTVQADYNAGILAATPAAGITCHDISSTLIYPTDFADALHPNQIGYQKMGIEFSSAIQAVLY